MSNRLLFFLIVATMSACSTIDRDRIESQVASDYRTTNQLMDKYRTVMRKKQNESKPLNRNWVNVDPVPYKRPLPAALRKKTALVVSEAEYATVILARASRLIGIPIKVEQDIFIKANLSTGSTTTTTTTTGTDSAGVPLPTSTTSYVDSNRIVPKITAAYQGPAAGLLDHLASSIGAQWRYDRKKNTVIFYRFVSRHFTISAQPGRVDSNATVSVRSASANSGQSRNEDSLTSNYSIWDNLKDSLETLLTDEGAYAINEAAGVVLVRDLPHAVDRVHDFIDQLNASLERGVILDIKVYSVSVEDRDNTAISWEALFESNSLSGQLSTPRASLANPSFLMFGVPSNASNSWKGSQWFLDRLATVGRVSLVTSGVLLSVNNKPAPISVGETIYYIANSDVTNTANVGTTTSVQQESVEVGFSASFLPRILTNGSDLSIRLALQISRLRSLDSVTVNNVFLERPRIERRMLSPEILIRSGQTLMIAGLSFATDSAVRRAIASPGAWWLGGGRDLSVLKNKLVILITPRIYRPGELVQDLAAFDTSK